jgi:hypothetical protein
MRRHHGLAKVGLVLALAALVAAGVATVGSARPDTVDTTAKLGPVPARAGNDALYRTGFTNSQGTMNKVTSVTTFPAGVSVVATTPAAPGCTVDGLVVTCSFGNVAAGVTVAASIQVTLANPFPTTALNVATEWRFKDPGGGQPGQAESYDSEAAPPASTPVGAANDATSNGDCLSNTGGESLTASLGDASISFTTPAFGSLLCVPLGLKVDPAPPEPVECFPGRTCTSEKLTSFAGATFSAATPAQGTLIWPSDSVEDKKAAVVFSDGVNPPLLVPLCSAVTLSAANPACEVGRKASAGTFRVNVRWLGNDPAWEM